MIRRTLLFLVVLISIGELIVRADEKMHLFQGDRGEVIANVYKDSLERTLADRHEYPHNPTDTRVMLLGDSKLYGVGLRPEYSVGALLVSQLRTALHRDDVHLLDVTIPGSNTFLNRRTFDQYLDTFAPQVVILGYNHNDVYGDQGPKAAASPDPHSTPPAAPNRVATIDRITTMTATMRDLLADSRVFSLALVKANMELKLAGVVVPGTEFYHLINRSHRKDYPGWIQSQKHLEDVAATCQARGILLIVYIVPELEMLPRYSVFDALDRYLMDYFGGLGVRAVNGIDPFRHQQDRDFALSRYDGHPNKEASAIMASHLSTVVATALQHGS